MLMNDALVNADGRLTRTSCLPKSRKATPRPNDRAGITTATGMSTGRTSGGGPATPGGVRHKMKESGTAAAPTPTVTDTHLIQCARVKLFMARAWVRPLESRIGASTQS